MSIKITAIENMFRLHGCPKDDTMYLFITLVYLRMYIKPFLLVAGAVFIFYWSILSIYTPGIVIVPPNVDVYDIVPTDVP